MTGELPASAPLVERLSDIGRGEEAFAGGLETIVDIDRHRLPFEHRVPRRVLLIRRQPDVVFCGIL